MTDGGDGVAEGDIGEGRTEAKYASGNSNDGVGNHDDRKGRARLKCIVVDGRDGVPD